MPRDGRMPGEGFPKVYEHALEGMEQFGGEDGEKTLIRQALRTELMKRMQGGYVDDWIERHEDLGQSMEDRFTRFLEEHPDVYEQWRSPDEDRREKVLQMIQEAVEPLN